MVNSAEFAKRLQKILEFYGLSATAFSEEIDFNRSTISHLLSGRNKPSLEFVMKVVQKFPEVELYWLLNGKGNFPSELSVEKVNKRDSSPLLKKVPGSQEPQSKKNDQSRENLKTSIFASEEKKKFKYSRNRSNRYFLQGW